MDEPAPVSTVDRRALVGLVVALALTFGLLLYAWGRILIFLMLMGRAEVGNIALLAAGIGAVIALTRGLEARLGPWRHAAGVPVAVAGIWAACNIILAMIFFDSVPPLLVVVALFFPSTLWVPWLAWMFYRPWRWTMRIGGLALLAAFVPLFPTLMKVMQLSGDAKPMFAWRSWTPDEALDVPKASEGDGEPTADLTATTPDDSPQFLGADRTGVIPHPKRLSRDWSSTPPKVLWKKPVGFGWSSFAVVGEYAVTQEQRGPQECVVCYRVADGSEAWIHADPSRFDSSMGGSGPRATPTIADGRVYVVGARGVFNCLDGGTGRPVWTVDLLKDNGGHMIEHGVCASPLVLGDRVVVCPTGGNAQPLATYDRQTGKKIWNGGRHPVSYGSPLAAEIGGRAQILLLNADGAEGVDQETGEFLWEYPFTTSYRQNCSQPVVVDGEAGRVLLSAGYGVGSVLLEVRPDSGKWSVKELWRNREMKTKFTSALLHGDHLFGLDDGILECIDARTGKRIKKGGRYQHGQVILAGDLLIVQAENGDVVLVEAGPELKELGKVSVISGKTWNYPALSGRRLLIRNDHEAACLELPVEEAAPPAE